MDGGGQPKMDPQLAAFIQQESQRTQLTAVIHKLADDCNNLCMPKAPPAKLDGKTETCLTNCVNTMIDASKFMVAKLSQQGVGGASAEPASSGGWFS